MEGGGGRERERDAVYFNLLTTHLTEPTVAIFWLYISLDWSVNLLSHTAFSGRLYLLWESLYNDRVISFPQWSGSPTACYTCQLRYRGNIGSLPGPNFAGQFKMVSTLSRKPTCAPSRHWLRSFPYVAVETVPMIIWLTMALFRPFKEGRRPIHTLSAPLSFWRSMMWRYLALWLQVAVSQVPQCLKLLNTSYLPRRKPLVLVAFSCRSVFLVIMFPLTASNGP